MVNAAAAVRVESEKADPDPLPPAVVGATVVLADHRRSIVIAEDDRRAQEIANIAAAFAPGTTVVYIPASDALPGDAAPASATNIGRRVAALRRLRVATAGTDNTPVILVVSADASADRYAAPSAFDEVPPVVRPGDAIDPAAFAARAAEIGYHDEDQVDEPGAIAIRGNVIDIFAADAALPIRIEFANGTVTGLRTYDPLTQLTVVEVADFTIGRASEPPLGDGVSIIDHLPGATILADAGVDDRRDRYPSIARDGEPKRRGAGELIARADWQKITKDRLTMLGVDHAAPPRFVEQHDPARAFERFAKSSAPSGPLLIAGAARDVRFFGTRLSPPPEPVESLAAAMEAPAGSVCVIVAPVDRGFVLDGLTVIAAADLLGSRARLDDAPVIRGAGFGDAAELHVGDVVVDEENGIGVVAGIEQVAALEREPGDAIVVEYAKQTRRLVPVEEANRLWRYGAEADAVKLDTLDGSSWTRRRARIDAAIAESARQLQALAVKRAARTTDPVVPDTVLYEQFAAGFPYSETADQARSIAAVRHDLASGQPMDRLVVGDVGYGKTEVALRAAALVALAGRQVAIVAPTTVLVRQHLATFSARFASCGLAVAGLSRVSTPAERRRVRAGLADGSIPIVVGTSAVAGKGVAYRDLALVVIDEEQRFGTAAKTALRDLSAGHVLTLSATPIPRTLQSAMVGLQAISIIATPPARRQPIRTVVASFDDDAVRRALIREHGRGGTELRRRSPDRGHRSDRGCPGAAGARDADRRRPRQDGPRPAR